MLILVFFSFLARTRVPVDVAAYYLILASHYLLRVPKRRVRDVVGPSPAADSLMVCVRTARRRPRDCSALYGFQLPLLLKLFCNQSCGHQQVDMLSLLLGRSRPGRQLVKVSRPRSCESSATTRRDSSRRPGKTHCKHGRIIGHAAMVRRSRTGHVVDMFAGRTQRHVARALALGRLSPGGLRAVSGWRIEVTVGPYWLLAPNG